MITQAEMEREARKARAQSYVQRLGKLKAVRGQWETLWQTCADYAIPRKNNITRTGQQGERKGINLYDSTATNAVELLAGALHGLMTNPTSLFFELTVADPKILADDECRTWLYDSTKRMHDELTNSNFQTETHEVYIDLGWAGTAGMFTEEEEEDEENPDAPCVRFSSRHIAELFVDENNKSQIDTVMRVYKWTARQITLEFEKDGFVPPEVLTKAESDPNTLFDLIHITEPRSKAARKDKKGPMGWPIASVFVLKNEMEILREGGFREMPYAVPRWTKDSGEVYGRSPLQNCLSDVMMIQEMMKTTIRAAQKQADPPLMAPDDGFIGPIKQTPGGLNFYRAGMGNDLIQEFGNKGRVDLGLEMMRDVRQRIRESFYIDQLQLQNGPQMTATEVNQRTEEKLRLMGPMLGRQQSEYLRPVLDRVFNIMLRRGKFKEVPALLRGKNVNFLYSSAIAKAQKLSEVSAISRTFTTIAPLTAADPSVQDNFDMDETARFIANSNSLPAQLLRKKKDIKAIRQGRADAERAQQEQESQMAQAQAAGQAAPAIQALQDQKGLPVQ
jgi:hypothetical protein